MSLDKPKNRPILSFENVKDSPSFIGGGRFNDSTLTLNGVGEDSTTTGTWVSLGVNSDHSGLLVQGCFLCDINADLIPGGLDASNSEIAAVNAATNPATIMNRDGSDAGRGTIVVDADDSIDSQLRIPTVDDEYLHYNLKVCRAGKGQWIPFVHQWSSGGKFQTIVDGLAVAESQIDGGYDWNSLDMTPYDARDPGASTDPNAIKNVALLDGFQDVGAARITIGFLGDSLLNFGGFPDWMWKTRTTQAPEWIPITNTYMTSGPKGIDGANGAALESVNGKHYDAGALTTIIREMHKIGYVSANNLNFTQGGATMAQIKTNASNMLTIGVPDVVFMNCGQNDANDGTSFTSAARMTFKANIRSTIAALKDGGVKQVVISNLHSMQNNSTYSADVYAANVDTCNEIIASLPDWSRSQGHGETFVTVADNFTAFGGRQFDSSLFITDDVHHQTSGSYLFGKTLADALRELLRVGRRGAGVSSRPRIVVKNFTPLGFGAHHDDFEEITEGVNRVRIGKRRAVKVGRQPKIRIT